jgi:3-hydroxy-9,10-secoandrosta-1,3,5(10)-triene-9,17-dione monooxygenase reductase component
MNAPTSSEVEGFRSDDFRRVLGSFCSGVTVITAASDGLVGMTCQSFFSLSLDPPLIAFSPSRASTSYPKIREARQFAVNILAADQAGLARQFARSGTDKWKGIDWTPGPASCPLLRGAVASIVCDLDAEHEAGDHYLVVGRVRHLIHNHHRRPLLFFNSRFTALAEEKLLCLTA